MKKETKLRKIKEYCFNLYQKKINGKRLYNNKQLIEKVFTDFNEKLSSRQINAWKKAEKWDEIKEVSTNDKALKDLEETTKKSREDCENEVRNRNMLLHEMACNYIIENGLQDTSEALALLKITSDFFKQKSLIDAKINNAKIENNELIQISFTEVKPRVVTDNEIERLENGSQ